MNRASLFSRNHAAACAFAASAVLCATACGGESSAVGPGGSSGSSGSTGSSGSVPSGEGDGPRVALALRGSTAPVPHADGFAGQTPSRQIVAIRSLWLYRSASDPSPVRVLDLGASTVESDLVGGTTTEVGAVPLRSLPAGTFTIAKVGVAYVRYSVASRMHAVITADGRYDNVQALSDGAVIDGQTHAKGWYRYELFVGATSYGVVQGEDAPVPQIPSSGGITLESSGPESFYVFPTLVVIDPKVTTDQRVVCEVNVHESFRWQDQDQPGYAANVYDTTPTSFEPVMAFGANGFSLKLEAK
jgi:hypothetical protein